MIDIPRLSFQNILPAFSSHHGGYIAVMPQSTLIPKYSLALSTPYSVYFLIYLSQVHASFHPAEIVSSQLLRSANQGRPLAYCEYPPLKIFHLSIPHSMIFIPALRITSPSQSQTLTFNRLESFIILSLKLLTIILGTLPEGFQHIRNTLLPCICRTVSNPPN